MPSGWLGAGIVNFFLPYLFFSLQMADARVFQPRCCETFPCIDYHLLISHFVHSYHEYAGYTVRTFVGHFLNVCVAPVLCILVGREGSSVCIPEPIFLCYRLAETRVPVCRFVSFRIPFPSLWDADPCRMPLSVSLRVGLIRIESFGCVCG